MGVEILGSAGDLVRAKLPGDEARLKAIAVLRTVDGLGATPRASKLPEGFVNEVLARSAHAQIPVFVTLMVDDPDGRWRRAMEDLGAIVGRYDRAIRVYAANVTYLTLDALAAADFVLAIEPISIVEAVHDTAAPAMGVDALRDYTGSSGLFSGIGGASVPIAVMDTGLNVNHLDIARIGTASAVPTSHGRLFSFCLRSASPMTCGSTRQDTGLTLPEPSSVTGTSNRGLRAWLPRWGIYASPRC